MRKLFAVAMVAGMLALSGTAQAVPTVSLVPTGPTNLGPGDTVTFQVILNNDTNLIAATFLVNSNNANAAATGATFTPAPFAPVGVPGIISPTSVGAFGGLLLVGSVAPGTYTMGTITYTGQGDGTTVIVAAQRLGVDDWFDAGYNIVNPIFQSSQITTVIPEPATAALIGFGLVGLVIAGRRNRV